VKSRRGEEEEKTAAGTETYKNSGTRTGTTDRVEEIGKAAGTRQEEEEKKQKKKKLLEIP